MDFVLGRFIQSLVTCIVGTLACKMNSVFYIQDIQVLVMGILWCVNLVKLRMVW